MIIFSNPDDKEIIGILQVIIKPKGHKIPEEDYNTTDEVANFIGLDEPTEVLIGKMATIIAISMNVYVSKFTK